MMLSKKIDKKEYKSIKKIIMKKSELRKLIREETIADQDEKKINKMESEFIGLFGDLNHIFVRINSQISNANSPGVKTELYKIIKKHLTVKGFDFKKAISEWKQTYHK